MNIFVLSESPKEAAKFHLSKHVVKMPLETAQMLSSVYHRYGLVGDSVSQEDLYKQAHKTTHVLFGLVILKKTLNGFVI